MGEVAPLSGSRSCPEGTLGRTAARACRTLPPAGKGGPESGPKAASPASSGSAVDSEPLIQRQLGLGQADPGVDLLRLRDQFPGDVGLFHRLQVLLDRFL